MDEEVAGLVVKLAIEDGSFQEGITNLNRQMKLADSEFKAAVGDTKSFGDSLDGLKANMDRLNQVTEIQAQLIEKYEERLNKSEDTLKKNIEAQSNLKMELDNTRQSYEKVTSSLGENSKEAKDLKDILDKLEKTYDDNNQKIRNNVKAIDNQTIALNQAKGKLRDFESQVKQTEQAIDSFDNSIDKMSTTSKDSLNTMNIAMGNLLAQGVEMLISGIADLTQQTFEFSKQVLRVHEVTGMSIESLQQWEAMFKQVGEGSIENFVGDLSMLAEKIMDCANDTGEGAELFGILGLSVVDTSGKLKSQEQVLNETISALQNMEDVTKRNAIASALLGTTGEELIPILNMTNEELEAMKANVDIVSERDLQIINDFRIAWEEFCNGAGKELVELFANILEFAGPLLDMLNVGVTAVLKMYNAIGDIINLGATWIGSILGIEESLGSLYEKGGEYMNNLYDGIGDKAESATKKINGEFEDVAENTEDAMTDMSENISDGFEEAQNEAIGALGAINDAVNKYYDKEKREYEKYLEERNGDTLDGMMKTEMEMLEFERGREAGKQRQIEKYSNLYGIDFKNYESYEQKKTMILGEEYSKREKLVGKSNNVGYTTSNIPAYATGTKFHIGGLALVGERGPELVNLPRGASVANTESTQDAMSKYRTGGETTITGNTFIVQANDYQEFVDSMERAVVSGEW